MPPKRDSHPRRRGGRLCPCFGDHVLQNGKPLVLELVFVRATSEQFPVIGIGRSLPTKHPIKTISVNVGPWPHGIAPFATEIELPEALSQRLFSPGLVKGGCDKGCGTANDADLRVPVAQNSPIGVVIKQIIAANQVRQSEPRLLGSPFGGRQQPCVTAMAKADHLTPQRPQCRQQRRGLKHGRIPTIIMVRGARRKGMGQMVEHGNEPPCDRHGLPIFLPERPSRTVARTENPLECRFPGFGENLIVDFGDRVHPSGALNNQG